MEELEYNGVNFLLFFPDETSGSYGQAEAVFQASSMADFDIYIFSSLPIRERQRRLFHEVIEASIRKQGFNNSEAHALAEKEEQKNLIINKNKSNEG